MRWVAWKAAMRADLGIAMRWNAGRSCWASGLVEEAAKVDSMRWAGAGCWNACLMRPGRRTEAIAANLDVQRRAERGENRRRDAPGVEAASTMIPRVWCADVPAALIG